MNINYKHIDALGGFIATEIELNTPEFQEVDEKTIVALLFDGFGVAICQERYLQLIYPKLEDAKRDKQARRTINQMRYGNRLEENFKITVDDLAICFAQVDEICQSEYLRLLTIGLFSNAKQLLKGANITADELREKLSKVHQNPCKHLFIFKDHDEFLKELDGKVYAVTDKNGSLICDLLEEDMITLEEQDLISDGEIVTTDSIEYICSQRVEIIILNR